MELKYVYLGKLRQVSCVTPSILTEGKSLLNFPKGWTGHLEGTYERQPYLHSFAHPKCLSLDTF